MRHRHKEPGEPFNKAESFGSRLEDWGQKVVIFPPNETAQPYIAHNVGSFHEPHNPSQRVHERCNTDVTRMIF